MKSVVFLMYHEDEDPIPLRIGVDMLCAMYGYFLMHIDMVGDMLSLSKEPYSNLDEALSDPRFAGWTWVFLDSRAEKTLDKFQHPADKVVYVFGSDLTGFSRPLDELPGETIKLKSYHHPEYEHFALACVASVAVHRFYQVDI